MQIQTVDFGLPCNARREKRITRLQLTERIKIFDSAGMAITPRWRHEALVLYENGKVEAYEESISSFLIGYLDSAWRVGLLPIGQRTWLLTG